jgi:chromosome condensin MukBEF complex kleisin-like MukF subunit
MFGFGSFAEFAFAAIKDAVEPLIHATTGGLPPKKVKTVIKKNQRDEIAEIVRQAFDELEPTVPANIVKAEQKVVKKEIAKIDLADYDFAIAQVNELLLQAKLRLQEHQAMLAELEDEESLLMLI